MTANSYEGVDNDGSLFLTFLERHGIEQLAEDSEESSEEDNFEEFYEKYHPPIDINIAREVVVIKTPKTTNFCKQNHPDSPAPQIENHDSKKETNPEQKKEQHDNKIASITISPVVDGLAAKKASYADMLKQKSKKETKQQRLFLQQTEETIEADGCFISEQKTIEPISNNDDKLGNKKKRNRRRTKKEERLENILLDRIFNYSYNSM